MRTLWNVVSFLAVVHLLALLMFAGWLWRTQRLDGARIQELRSILSTTAGETRRRERDAALEAEWIRKQQEDEARRRTPPLPSGENVSVQQRTQQAAQLASRHVDDTRQQLQRQIDLTAQQLREQRAEVEAQRQALAGDAAAAAREEQQQMDRAVKLLESLPPKQAKMRLIELCRTGRMDQAVAYLNAMRERSAAKVLAEFKTDLDNPLATELLERIRTLRLPRGAAAPEPGNAQPATAAALGP
jgi:hypothetical protein